MKLESFVHSSFSRSNYYCTIIPSFIIGEEVWLAFVHLFLSDSLCYSCCDSWFVRLFVILFFWIISRHQLRFQSAHQTCKSISRIEQSANFSLQRSYPILPTLNHLRPCLPIPIWTIECDNQRRIIRTFPSLYGWGFGCALSCLEGRIRRPIESHRWIPICLYSME